jgi:hypothetical protein
LRRRRGAQEADCGSHARAGGLRERTRERRSPGKHLPEGGGEDALTALDYNPKAPFSIPTEACERLEVAFRELADTQRHAGDSMGAVEWSSLTPDALLVRLLIDEWEAC